ncbi:hypothetical protein LVJ82_02855 [Vitreoscilla massiliensis]|uniref:Uncharacterized protein n=1 Tax=Vitreoscilla massiliensis TaxID=1689272 RepID=A0ABY4E3J2_9NEIS|nr:hypothetical protein [Vitreoscilla massiliensis]UOO89945.1 hypothetical protein LVJ82_02855 [Vitreoscilla massiliensis]
MGIFSFGVSFSIMVMMVAVGYHMQNVDRYAGVEQTSLRHIRRCLVCMYAVLVLSWIATVREIWRLFPNWEEMIMPLLSIVFLALISYFARLIHPAYLEKRAVVEAFSSKLKDM